MKRTKLLDSYAILLWIQDERGAQAVEDLFLSAQKGQVYLAVSEPNLGEVYHKVFAKQVRFRQAR